MYTVRTDVRREYKFNVCTIKQYESCFMNNPTKQLFDDRPLDQTTLQTNKSSITDIVTHSFYEHLIRLKVMNFYKYKLYAPLTKLSCSHAPGKARMPVH